MPNSQAEDTACLCCSLRGLVVRSTGRMRVRGEGSHAATTVTPLPQCHKNSFLSLPFLLRTWASHMAHGIFATRVDLILLLGLTLLEGDKSPTLEDLSRACYWPSMLIFKVPGHAHIQVDDTLPRPHCHCSCALRWPHPLPPSATPSRYCYRHVPSRLWNIFPHSSIDFGRSIGDRRCPNLFAFPELLFARIVWNQNKNHPTPLRNSFRQTLSDKLSPLPLYWPSSPS